MSEKKSSFFKSVMNLAKKADYFGVVLNFQIKDKESYTSSFGGFVFIGFFIFSVIYLSLNFINLVDRSQFSLIYNEAVTNSAPPLDFGNFSIAFAIGLNPGDPKLMPTVYKYLEISFNFVSLVKSNGTISKNKIKLPLNKCNYSLMNNLVNKTFDELGLSNFFCPNISNFNVQGIFTENTFNYFEYVTTLKPEYYNSTSEVKKLFVDNEIKSEFYYIDSSIVVFDYGEPVKKFINSQFTTIDWGFFKKLNIDFLQLTFVSDANYFFEDGASEDIVLIDKTKEYYTMIGDDRFITKQRDFNTFSKMYIRSSTTRKLIQRVYLKVTEYLANTSSILSTGLLILFVIVSYINVFKAQQSIMKNILKFKENLNHKNSGTIKYMKEKFSNDIIQYRIDEFGRNVNHSKSEMHNSNESINNANINDIKLERHLSRSPKKEITNNFLSVINIDLTNKNNKDESLASSVNRKINPSIKTLKEIPQKNNNFLGMSRNKKNEQINVGNRSVRRNSIFIPKYKSFSVFHLNDDKDKEDENNILKPSKSVPMKYNTIEIILKNFCYCCLSKSIKIKNKLHEQGFSKFNYHMDILTYIRKMQEIDILKYLLLTDDQIILFNFLSKPSVSLVGKNILIESLHQRFNVDINLEEITRIHKAYNNLYKNAEIEGLNKKILELTSAEVDNLVSD